MISSNHDSDDRLNYGSTLFDSNQIFISAIYDGHLDMHAIKDGNTEINVYFFPFVKVSQVKHFFLESDIESYEDEVTQSVGLVEKIGTNNNC